MTKSIKVGGCNDVGQWIVIRPYCERLVLEVFPELLRHGPFEGQEFELGGMILGLPSLQFSTGKGHRVVMPAVRLLEEYGAQPLSGGISRNGFRKSANTRTGTVMHFFFRSWKA